MTDEKPLTEAERERALLHFHKKEEMSYKAGRAIVIAIAVVYGVASIANFIEHGSFIGLAVDAALTIALLAGVSWVRYLYAAFAGICGLLLLCSFLSNLSLYCTATSRLIVLVVIFQIFLIAFSVWSCIVLFTSRSVSEFLN